MREIDDMIAEVAEIPEQNIIFVDDDLNGFSRKAKERCLELFRALAAAHDSAVSFDPNVLGEDVNATKSDDDLADHWSFSIEELQAALPPSAAMWVRLELLRELVGNPFREIGVDPAWLMWQGGIVARLAQAAFEERRLPDGTLDPANLGLVADALEDAGCADADLLGQLRGPGPHVSGC